MSVTIVAKQGALGTGSEAGLPAATSVNPTSRVLDVSAKVHLLDADNNPLVIFAKKAGKKVATNPQFRWQEDRFEPKSVTLDTTALAALDDGTTTTFSLPAGQEFYATVGDLMTIPGSAGAAPNNYDEIMLVTAVASNGLDLTVVRNFSARSSAWAGTPALVALTAYLTGTAFEEGSAAATPKSTKIQFKSNFTEIFKDAFAVTGTDDASEMYSGPDRPRLRRKKALKHMRDIERALILGQPKEDVTTGSYPRRSTGGVLYHITTNVEDRSGSGGGLNYQVWTEWAESVFRYGESKTRLVLASAEVITAVDMMANDKYFAKTPEEVYGVRTMRIATSHGDFLLVRHKQFGDMGLNGYAIALDMQDVNYRFMRGRDTKFFSDIQTPGDDLMKDQYLTECGLEFPLEERSGVLKGVTGYVA